MTQSVLTSEQRAAYERDGFVMVRGLFDPDETLCQSAGTQKTLTV
jgi:hypothetical protein